MLPNIQLQYCSNHFIFSNDLKETSDTKYLKPFGVCVGGGDRNILLSLAAFNTLYLLTIAWLAQIVTQHWYDWLRGA